MRTATVDYIAAEEADEREPAELYHIWRDGGEHWRLTSGDKAETYDGNSYTPATLSRSQVSYNSQLDVTTIQVTTSSLADPVFDYIAINPIELLWISISKIHRGMSPIEVSVIFIGQIKDVSFKGGTAQVNCVGFEHFLKKTIPAWRYQLTCNHQVFDTKCALTKASYKTTETITLDATKTILTGTDFGLQVNGYFIGGEVVFGTESRTITAHTGTAITIMYPFVELVSTDDVDAYPGCDGRAETCRDKYSNILNFLGMPFIPIENPALRVTW